MEESPEVSDKAVPACSQGSPSDYVFSTVFRPTTAVSVASGNEQACITTELFQV